MKDKFLITIDCPEWRKPMLDRLNENGYDIYVITDLPVPEGYYKVTPNSFFGCYFLDSKRFDGYEKGVCIFDKRLFLWLIHSKLILKSYLWGIGNGNNYLGNKIRVLISKKSLGLISYMPIDDSPYKKAGFIVNSVFSEAEFSWGNSNKLLFIGGLNKRKRLDILISALEICHSLGYYFTLDIIGDGSQRKQLELLVENLGLKDFVNFHGHISNTLHKSKIIKGSFLSVSPGQAGLSILEAMSYGVPFLTAKNAISGGEIMNITDSYNGYLIDNYHNPIDLALKIISIKKNERNESVAHNSFEYYNNYANGESMTIRFLKIIED